MPINIAHGVQQFSVWILPLVLAITLHEAAHGYAALRLGDDTAARMGRISINPIRHIDPFGTLLLPGLLILSGSSMLFGWAKPVPVNFSRLHPLRIGMAIVGAAGPATNVVLAIVSVLLIYVVPLLPEVGQAWALENLEHSAFFNLILAIFNMIPIPPLDGGRVAVGLLPRSLAYPLARAERYTFPILIVALLVLPFLHVNVFGWLVGAPAYSIDRLFHAVVGINPDLVDRVLDMG
jgi:Zn-dependent protease